MMGYGQPSPHRPPPSHPAGYDPHAEYELVFQAVGSVEEYASQQCRQTGVIRIIQGPKQLTVKTADAYMDVFSFLSINNLNVPLLPSQSAKFVSPYVYAINVPGRTFLVTLDPSTPDEFMREFEKILSWFCSFQAPHDINGNGNTNSHGMPNGMARKIDTAGNRGVDMVERIAGTLQDKLSRTLEPRLRAARESENKRDVKMGGRATATVLGGTRSAVGKVAGFAGVVTDKAANVVGGVLANNPVMTNMRNAPHDSKRYGLHETLTAGMVSVGKVYVAADEKGRALVSTWGDNSSEILREKYGGEVADAAQNSTRIALDSYRIMRFPAKFGAAALLKGAAKASVHRNSPGANSSSHGNVNVNNSRSRNDGGGSSRRRGGNGGSKNSSSRHNI